MSRLTDPRIKPLLAVLFVLGSLACLIFLHTCWVLGIIDGLRAVTSMVMPLSLIWWLLLATCVWWLVIGRWKLGVFYLILWLSMTIAFNSRFADMAIGRLERPTSTPGEATRDQPFRAVVVLGGGTFMNAHNTPELNNGGERVFSAAQAWHAGETDAIICTGDRPAAKDPQSDIASDLLRSVGVPAAAVYQIGGENTKQEMEHLRRFLDMPPAGIQPDGQVGLITSAFHMPRAMRLARQQNLKLVAASVRVSSGQIA